MLEWQGLRPLAPCRRAKVVISGGEDDSEKEKCREMLLAVSRKAAGCILNQVQESKMEIPDGDMGGCLERETLSFEQYLWRLNP